MRAEGVLAALDRASDRFAEWDEDRRASRRPLGRADVLNVVGFPLAARLGGVPLQLRRRLEQERRERRAALLSRTSRGWRLERFDGPDREAVTWDAPAPAAPALDDPSLAPALARAVKETDARAVHVEGLAGLAPRGLAAALEGRRSIVTVHDFTPWCPRPHLWEPTEGRFCRFSRDPDRCHACLRVDFDLPRGFEAGWRAAAAEVLVRAEAVVFPSAYLRDATRELLPSLDPARQDVIEPGALEPRLPAPAPAGAVRRVALVGAATEAKGARLLPAIVRAAEGLRFAVLGGGDADVLRALRGLPRTSVRGYYRAGSLPHHLRARGTDVALLLSRVPESYGIALDECWRAGVPVVAFDHGALADRIRARGGGVLVRLEQGAEGVAAVLRALEDGSLARPPVPAADSLASPDTAARAHADLYRRLGLLESRA